MNDTIGQRIKKRRKELHITGSQIEKDTGISTGNLSDIENGKILPSANALIGLSKILKCSSDYILFGDSHILGQSKNSALPNSEQTLSSPSRTLATDNQEINTLIGQRIKNRRNELHITQMQIQEFTGISSGNLSGIENGRYLPSTSALLGLSKILDCSIDWLLTGKSFSSTDMQDCNFKKGTLLSYFSQLSDDDQEELLMIAQMKFEREKKREKNHHF